MGRGGHGRMEVETGWNRPQRSIGSQRKLAEAGGTLPCSLWAVCDLSDTLTGPLACGTVVGHRGPRTQVSVCQDTRHFLFTI